MINIPHRFNSSKTSSSFDTGCRGGFTHQSSSRHHSSDSTHSCSPGKNLDRTHRSPPKNSSPRAYDAKCVKGPPSLHQLAQLPGCLLGLPEPNKTTKLFLDIWQQETVFHTCDTAATASGLSAATLTACIIIRLLSAFAIRSQKSFDDI